MKRNIVISLVAAWVFAVAASAAVPRTHNFDFDWQFRIGDAAEWRAVQLPHDWSMELPYVDYAHDSSLGRFASMGFMQGGTGFYRKTFEVPSSWRGKRVSIEFDGVYHNATVAVNGRELGTHRYGYTAFSYDITDCIKTGTNEITVKVDHSDCPTSRWYSGSGIYRHVRLVVTDPVHIAKWGTFVTTPEVSASSAKVLVRTTLSNDSAKAADVSLISELVSPEGKTVAKTASSVAVMPGSSAEVAQEITLVTPALWDIDDPNLYTLVSTVRKGVKVVDRYETVFGVRDIRFDADKGFFLNGRHVKMKGGNVHQDAGSLGAAMPDRAIERKIEAMKNMGFNAIRCSHNPPAKEFLDFCDRIGMLVIDEAFDKWKSGYYKEYYDECWKDDLASMILRDRNHPSVVLWSVGNETSEQKDMSGAGTARLKALRKEAERLDGSRKVSVTVAPDYNHAFNRNGFCQTTEVVGYNYYEAFMDDDHKAYPGTIMYGSEVFPYYMPGRSVMREYIERNPWYHYAERDYLFGYFMWAAPDYWGESSGYPSKGWPTGVFDNCMFEKPNAAFFRAVWNEEPIVRINVASDMLDMDPGKDMWSWPFMYPSWTFPGREGYIVEVQTITNCEEVELFVNGVTLGRRRTADFPNNTIVWKTTYKPGTITAKAYNGGKEICTDELKTAKTPARIVLEADRDAIRADGQDLSHISIRLEDADGVPVPDNDRRLKVTVEGAGRFLAMDNGDMRDGLAQLRDDKPTYFGKALAVVQASREGGEIRVKVSSEGLPDSEIVITAYDAVSE